MTAMEETNGKLTRLSAEEVAALTRPAKITDPEERRSAVKRATSGLRVGDRVTRSLYRPR